MIELPIYVVFFASLAVGYATRRNAYLGPIDPLQGLALSEAVWVVTVYELTLAGVASSDQAAIFAACLSLWWAGWWVATRRFGASYRRSIAAFWYRMAAAPAWLKRRLLLLYLVGLSVLLAVTIVNGGGGDNRLVIMKLLKPMESITTLLVPTILFNLMTAKGRWPKVLLALILVCLVYTGGKAAILSILLPVTGAAMIGRIRIRASLVIGLGVVSLLGFGASAMINYHVSDPIGVIELLYVRISMEADVYLLALTNDRLSFTQTTSLTAYLLGPLIKLLFLPITVDTNIGAQIGSLLRGEDTVNGPNPHWPIVLMAYHQSLTSAIVLSLIAFTIVVCIKLRLMRFCQKRKWPLYTIIPLGGFLLNYPQLFFADPSFPLIYLLQAGILSVILAVVLKPPAAPASRMTNESVSRVGG